MGDVSWTMLAYTAIGTGLTGLWCAPRETVDLVITDADTCVLALPFRIRGGAQPMTSDDVDRLVDVINRAAVSMPVRAPAWTPRLVKP